MECEVLGYLILNSFIYSILFLFTRTNFESNLKIIAYQTILCLLCANERIRHKGSVYQAAY